MILLHAVAAVATQEIIEEYQSTIDYLLRKYDSREVNIPLDIICSAMEIIPAQSRVKVCRDPDDDKFISCAMDGRCYYIVSERGQGFADVEKVSRRQDRDSFRVL